MHAGPSGSRETIVSGTARWVPSTSGRRERARPAVVKAKTCGPLKEER